MGMQTPEHLINSQSRIPEPWRRELNFAVPDLPECRRGVLLGLPCAHCKKYFAADLEACPLCGCNGRVPLATECRTPRRSASSNTFLA
jgi:hypothetical protein